MMTDEGSFNPFAIPADCFRLDALTKRQRLRVSSWRLQGERILDSVTLDRVSVTKQAGIYGIYSTLQNIDPFDPLPPPPTTG